jgi:ABC-type transport system substrate-binding protein
MNPIPDLAESMLVEIQSNNSVLPLNHIRFTFGIIHNATWSDGEPLTAEDVAFTFNYVHESGAYGNPAADVLTDFVTAYAPSSYEVVIEFSTESYLHFYNIAYQYIIPKHIFTTIGYEGWNTWNPAFNPEEPHVTCGPFLLTDFEAGEWYELTVNPRYHWLPYRPPSPSFTNTSTPTPTSFAIFQILLYTVLSASTVVFVGVILLLIRERKYSG